MPPLKCSRSGRPQLSKTLECTLQAVSVGARSQDGPRIPCDRHSQFCVRGWAFRRYDVVKLREHEADFQLRHARKPTSPHAHAASCSLSASAKPCSMSLFQWSGCRIAFTGHPTQSDKSSQYGKSTHLAAQLETVIERVFRQTPQRPDCDESFLHFNVFGKKQAIAVFHALGSESRATTPREPDRPTSVRGEVAFVQTSRGAVNSGKSRKNPTKSQFVLPRSNFHNILTVPPTFADSKARSPRASRPPQDAPKRALST